jgi:energy-converting hydrogenase A subunit M
MPCTLCGNNGHNRRTCQRWDLLLDARHRENIHHFTPSLIDNVFEPNNTVIINDNNDLNIIQNTTENVTQLPPTHPPISRNVQITTEEVDTSQISDYNLLKRNYEELKNTYKLSRDTIREMRKQKHENNSIIQDLITQKKNLLCRKNHYKEECEFLEFQNNIILDRYGIIAGLFNIYQPIEDVDITDEQFKTIIEEKTIHLKKPYIDNKLKLIQKLYSQTKTNHECPICFETIPSKNLFVSECGHSFCLSCVKQIHKNECPMCRHSIGPFIK